MKLTAQLKLVCSREQADSLKDTLERVNAACDYISERGWQARKLRQYDLHKLVYHEVRERFGLSAQVTVRAIAKVADAYKLDKQSQRRFAKHGSIAYDLRNLSYRPDLSTASITTLDGRIKVPYVCSERAHELMKRQQGESDLVYRKGVFYLFATCEVEEADPIDFNGVLGVDLGIKNIAADSDGELHSGGQVNGLRHRHRRLRTRLQSKGTTSAKRLLVKRSTKERRFASHTNHFIAKKIVTKAERTKRAIAVEELTHIRTRIRAHRSQRATLHSWAFAQLQGFIEYKARLVGVPVIYVDPRNTSRTCPVCGCIDKANRSTQDRFLCCRCAYAGHADLIAAENISRAAIVQPYAPASMPGARVA